MEPTADIGSSNEMSNLVECMLNRLRLYVSGPGFMVRVDMSHERVA